jgi:L,D-transpeptidase YcbB
MRSNGTARVAGVPIRSMVVLPGMYEKRGFQPLWTNPAAVDDMLRAIRESNRDGLVPADYHLAAIERLRAAEPAAAAADLDLLLTDAFVLLAYNLRVGKADPEQLDPNWNHPRELRGVDPVSALLTAIDSGQVATFLQGLAPQQPFYQRLKQGLARYREIGAAGGWPVVEAGPTLRPLESDARVPLLRRRLAASGDLSAADAAAGGEQYDEPLVAALKAFQQRHGLAADGVIGPGTIRELNIPVEVRIDQIRATLERSRWVMNDLPERFVLVNVAGFEVYVMEHGERKWSSRVVVGTPYTKTPIFRADMKYVVLNPTWTIPASIVRKEIRPAMRRDPNYLARKGYKQINGQFVQPAGPKNALGRIKLMFPNSHSVYLHDTPSKSYFEDTSRTFSHGCVRVQEPVQLAAQVLDDAAWNEQSLEDAIATGKTRTVMLKQPIPVLILYWTAAVDSDGRVTFRRDIYDRDAAVIAALNQRR